MNVQQLSGELSKKIDVGLVNALLDEYRQAKSAHGISDTAGTLNHGGQFCEVCIACVANIADPADGKNLNGIYFDAVYTKLLRRQKTSAEEELLYAVIPAVLKTIWTLRSKKKAVHFKSNIADEVDAELVITACNWVMAQLIALYYTKDQQEIFNILHSLMERKIPTIERFEDGKIMILKDLTFGEQLLLLLYNAPGRMTVAELDSLLNPKQRSYINTYLTRLFEQRLIHYDGAGAIINRNGITEIENNNSKYFNTAR